MISKKMTCDVQLVILACVLVFHTLILTGVIPFKYVWGGRLKDIGEMLIMEGVSISLNVIMFVVVLIKGDYLSKYVKSENLIVKILLWLFFVLFTFNTIGNLFAKSSLETYIATPLTFISALLFLRLALYKEDDKNASPEENAKLISQRDS